jgi:hypothetical protein
MLSMPSVLSRNNDDNDDAHDGNDNAIKPPRRWSVGTVSTVSTVRILGTLRTLGTVGNLVTLSRLRRGCTQNALQFVMMRYSAGGREPHLQRDVVVGHDCCQRQRRPYLHLPHRQRTGLISGMRGYERIIGIRGTTHSRDKGYG